MPNTRQPSKPTPRSKPKRSKTTESRNETGHGLSPDGVRLNVFLQERGVASRRKADELISSGRITVNNKVVVTLGARVAEGAIVCVDGKPVKRALPGVTYLFNKPDLCITSRNDPQGRRTIFDLAELRKLPGNVQAVGRLDFRSEGLLILTNDGNLAYALTHPRFSVEKRYACLLADTINPEEIENLRKGVVLDDGLAKPVAVRQGGRESVGTRKGQWVEVVVTEGRNRLVRRMFEALGHKVVRLVRVSIGDIDLPLTLKPEHIVPVDGEALRSLQRLRDAFLRQDGEKRMSPQPMVEKPKGNRRKARGLNDEDYAFEAARRARESEDRRRQRLEKTNSGKPNVSRKPAGSNPTRPTQPKSSKSSSAAGKPEKSSPARTARPRVRRVRSEE
jgi:pseudouridine synthase